MNGLANRVPRRKHVTPQLLEFLGAIQEREEEKNVFQWPIQIDGFIHNSPTVLHFRFESIYWFLQQWFTSKYSVFFGAIFKLELNLTDGSLRCQWTPFADWIRNSWRGGGGGGGCVWGGAGERITHYSLIQMLELELNFDVSISNGIDDGLRCSQLWIISKILA